MQYVGLQQQITSNSRKSVILLLMFPLLVLVMVYLFSFFLHYSDTESVDVWIDDVNQEFIQLIPFTLIAVGIWFLIAYFGNTAMINAAASSQTLSRTENMRVYNLTENLCMSVGMTMPKLRIIESDALNAFASGINQKNYTVTLTRGIIDTLDDDELEGVIAHELTHIRNHDVKLLIISIVFVGIFSFIMQMAYRSILWGSIGSSRSKKDNEKGGAAVMLVILVMAAVAYFLSILFKLALSRKREYLADSGAIEMTKKPLALAGALEKISGNSHIDKVKSADLEQLFIDNSPAKNAVSNAFSGIANLFSTHPPIEKRIQLLRQF